MSPIVEMTVEPTNPESSSGTSAPSSTEGTNEQRYQQPAGKPQIPAVPTPLPKFDPGGVGEVVDTRPLLQALTDAIQAADEEEFLSYFVGDAQRAAWFWWRNVTALGMDSGAVGVQPGMSTAIRLDTDRQGMLFGVELGAHHTSDEVDQHGLPIISTSTYYWGIDFGAGAQTQPVITNWISIDRAPWDCACELVVVKGTAGVVAAYPDESDLPPRILADLDRAYEWIQVYWKAFGHPMAVPRPVVAFATSDQERTDEWFMSVDIDRQEKFDYAGLVSFQDRYYGPDLDVSGQTYGSGSRMVLTGYSVRRMAIAVHEMVHYYLAPLVNDWDAMAGRGYLYEGIATMVENVYRGTDLAAAKSGQWKSELWNAGQTYIRSTYDDDFRETLPSDRLLYGDDSEFWYLIASTPFQYLAEEYGYQAALAAAVCSYQYGEDIFDCVPNPEHQNPGTGEPGAGGAWKSAYSVRRAWLAWVQKTLD